MRDNGPIALRVGVVGNFDIAVGAGATVYTDAFSLCDLNDFALTYKVTCTGTPDVKIELEQAIVAPTNPNASDSNYATPETIQPIETSLTNKNIHHRQLAPVTVEFHRFKITENTGLVADTVVNMWLSVQRKWSHG